MELPAPKKRILYLLFALSGFCALVYEILWSKYLSLTFGNTMTAVSIVAATFMGGLALGSYLVGKRADQDHNLLRLYALLEAGIALFALLFPPTIQLVTIVHTFIEQLVPSHPAIAHTVHFIFAGILLVPPTICMGGTFPLMCRFFARKKSGGQIGRLYALNTLGATAGAFLAGYVLIPNLGLSLTGYLAVGLNGLIALGTMVLAKQFGHTTGSDLSAAKRPEQPLRASQHRLVLISIGLIGFLSLAFELLWTRVFLLFLGNTSYAFALILSAFLIGIALGGAIYARKVHPHLNEMKVFIHLSLLMGLSVLLTVPFYDRLAEVFLFAHQLAGSNWWLLTFFSFTIVVIVLGLPTLLSGSLLPAAVAILDPGKTRTGEGVGLVVLYNTVGAMFGSLAAGFILIPVLGLQNSFYLLGGLCLLLTVVLGLRFRPSGWRRVSVAVLIAASLLFACLPHSWDQALMNSGVYIYAHRYHQMGGLHKILASEKIVQLIEGRDCTVAVHQSHDGEARFFTVNGKTDGGNGADMATQILIGQLPMLLHPAPEDVMVIGLGTGITLNNLSAHPTRQIDCVEISPEVVTAADWFRKSNGHSLSDPKVNLIIEDGRNLLLSSPKRYDVIISEPSNPWQSGNANLFTDDFYKLAANRLNPGGLFTQWVGLYDITPDNLKTICATFLQTFPRVMVFKAGSDLILIGAYHPLVFDYGAIGRRLSTPAIQKTWQRIGLASLGDLLAGHYLYSEESLARFAQGARLNTDDLPVLEYSARYNLGELTLGAFERENLSQLRSAGGRTTLPLVNLGRSKAAIASSLQQLARGYAKAGRQAEADYFNSTARELEANLSQITNLPAGARGG